MAVNQSDERSRFLNRMIKDNEIILGKDGERTLKFSFNPTAGLGENVLCTDWLDGETLAMDGPGGEGGWDWWLEHDDDVSGLQPADGKFPFTLLDGLEHNAELYHIYENFARYYIMIDNLRAFNMDYGDWDGDGVWTLADATYGLDLVRRCGRRTLEMLKNYIRKHFDLELAKARRGIR